MATAVQHSAPEPTRSLGHVALHYHRPEEGPLAARLLAMLGFVETQDMILPDGSHFYAFVVDPHHRHRGDGILFLSVMPEPQRALMAAMRGALGIGTADEHPTVAAMRAHVASEPEAGFHIGTLVDNLEALEATFTALEEANRADPELKGRLRLTYNRARPGDPAIDARLDASPIFAGVTRYAYGRGGVQAFVETDLLASGALGETAFLEFDYIFPDRGEHVLSAVELQ